MALVIGKKTTRIMPIKAVEPLDNDKTLEHRFAAEITVLPRDDWRAITDRWDTLGNQLQREQHALQRGLDYDPLSDDDRFEAKRPAIVSVAHVIKNIDLDVEDESGMALDGNAKIDALINIPWIAEPLFNAIVAVQNGMTTDAYRKARAKN